MKALFENIKINLLSNIQGKVGHLNSPDYYLNTKVDNNQNINEKLAKYNYNVLLNNEKINNLIQKFKELNIQYLKERQNPIEIDDKKNINNSKQSLNYREIININSQNDKKKNNIDSLSEIKKFKTELCHSWELTGTCKYGLNVSFIIYNNFLNLLIIVCLCPWS
jgi:hypothetical protein